MASSARCLAAMSCAALALAQAAAEEGEAVTTSALVPEPEQESPDEVAYLPLCHHTIVSETCSQLAGFDFTPGVQAIEVEDVPLARLAELLSCEADTPALWSALGIEDASKDIVACQDLCEAAVSYIDRNGGVLPPASDLGCYTVHGTTTCDIDVTPQRLASLVHPEEDPLPDSEFGDIPPAVEEPPNDDTVSPPLEEPALEEPPLDMSAWQRQKEAGGSLRGYASKATDAKCVFSQLEMAERLANAFRVYPSRETLLVNYPENSAMSTASAAEEAAIARANTEAKAWLSNVANQMSSQRTGSFLSKWFGGAGSLSSESVRARVLQTMNFIQRELIDGIRFVYPADDRVNTACIGYTLAHISQYQPPSGYYETKGPVCSSSDDPFQKKCGVDSEGRYFVYLCRRWYTSTTESKKISSIVHEAAHHAGTGDVTYDKTQMQRLSQSQQLENAASYENFAQEVSQSTWSSTPPGGSSTS